MDARRELLLPISDECLEIGFGTGLNLAFYQNLNVLYALEPNAHIEALSSERLAQSNFEIRHLRNFAESIPLPTNSIKNVVSTWTMCSVPKLEQALAEIYRVMEVGGTFHLVEHVYSDQTSTQRWQNVLTPLQKKLADGCHLNRNIEHYLKNAGFEVKCRNKAPLVRDRINAVNSKLKNVKGQNSLFILNSCKNVIKSIERQIYKEGTHIPDKDSGYDHMNDALGYLIEYNYPLKRDFNPSPPQRFS